jgi:ABC-type transporter MlaC component
VNPIRLNGIMSITLLSFFVFTPATRPAIADDETAAIAVVERIHQAASTQSLNALRSTIDAPAIARTVLGTYWQSASASERRDFTDALTDAIVDALVRRFTGQAATDFTVLGSRRLSNGDILVSTRMTRPDSRMINLDWRTHRCRVGFCIADVLTDGASVSIQRRDEYMARMKANGGSIAELISSLRGASPSQGVQ